MKTYLVISLILLGALNMFSQTIDGKHINDFGCYGEKKLNKAPKKIYISSFKVFYQVYISDKHKDSKNSGSPEEFEATLIGIDTANFQNITDELYNYFVDSLTRKGYELVPFDSVKKGQLF